MSRSLWTGLAAVVVCLAGCGKAPDATGEWQGDGEWHARQVADAVKQQDRQARVMVPSMPPLLPEVTQPDETVVQFYSRLRLSMRPDGTCHFGAAAPPDEAGADRREGRHQAELIRVLAPVPDVYGTWKQSCWRVTLTDDQGDTRQFRLLDADTAELITGDDTPVRFKRVR